MKTHQTVDLQEQGWAAQIMTLYTEKGCLLLPNGITAQTHLAAVLPSVMEGGGGKGKSLLLPTAVFSAQKGLSLVPLLGPR